MPKFFSDRDGALCDAGGSEFRFLQDRNSSSIALPKLRSPIQTRYGPEALTDRVRPDSYRFALTSGSIRRGGPGVIILHPCLAKRLLVGMVLDNIGIQPVCNLRKVAGSHHPIHLVASQVFGLDQKDGQEPGIDVPGVPEGTGQLVVGLDLRGKLPDVTKPDAELIVPGATLFVLRRGPSRYREIPVLREYPRESLPCSHRSLSRKC